MRNENFALDELVTVRQKIFIYNIKHKWYLITYYSYNIINTYIVNICYVIFNVI